MIAPAADGCNDGMDPIPDLSAGLPDARLFFANTTASRQMFPREHVFPREQTTRSRVAIVHQWTCLATRMALMDDVPL
jgi:hypothetical protein